MTPFWAFLAASAAAGVLVWAGHRWVTRAGDTWPPRLPDWSDTDLATLRGDTGDEPGLFDPPAPSVRRLAPLWPGDPSEEAPVSPVWNRGAA